MPHLFLSGDVIYRCIDSPSHRGSISPSHWVIGVTCENNRTFQNLLESENDVAIKVQDHNRLGHFNQRVCRNIEN